MSRFFGVIKGLPDNFPQAMLEVKVSDYAERLLVYDRKDMAQLYYIPITSSRTIRVRMPMNYAISNDLLVGILDDNAEYDCMFQDGIQAQIINGAVTLIHS